MNDPFTYALRNARTEPEPVERCKAPSPAPTLPCCALPLGHAGRHSSNGMQWQNVPPPALDRRTGRLIPW